MEDWSLVLASASPRRAALLEQLGLAFSVRAADVDETRRADEPAADYVQRLALAKARAVAANAAARELVMGADTTVALDGACLGKPADESQARAIWARLGGRSHQVHTAVALVHGDAEQVVLQCTEVTLRVLSESEQRAYWRTGEPQDKAGAYAIQGRGAVFVSHLVGSYSGVMGLPLHETAALLERWQYPVWPGWRSRESV